METPYLHISIRIDPTRSLSPFSQCQSHFCPNYKRAYVLNQHSLTQLTPGTRIYEKDFVPFHVSNSGILSNSTFYSRIHYTREREKERVNAANARLFQCGFSKSNQTLNSFPHSGSCYPPAHYHIVQIEPTKKRKKTWPGFVDK
jgi:hypothetical protein